MTEQSALAADEATPAARQYTSDELKAAVLAKLTYSVGKNTVAASQRESPEAALRAVYGPRTPFDLERQFAALSRSDRPFALAHQTLVASSRPSKDDALAE